MAIIWKSVVQCLLMGVLFAGLASAEPAVPYQIKPYDSTAYEALTLGRDGRPGNLLPKEVYGTAPHIGIRIANGGAGYTGLLRALSEAYLKTRPTIQGKPFSIAWYATNTTYSYYALRDHVVDLSLVYEIWPDALQGPRAYAQRPLLLFNDAFIFVGPMVNPAGLVPASANEPGDSLDEMLDKIIATGCQQPFATTVQCMPLVRIFPEPTRRRRPI